MTVAGPSTETAMRRRRLAIIGAGSSGLICLKNALDTLGDWDIVCFERTDRITGCWGNPYPGFVSTSTKYSTQFACFPLFDATMKTDGGRSRAEFFRDDQYGQYLEQFAKEFSLHGHIALHSCVESMRRGSDGLGWDLSVTAMNSGRAETTTEHFDCVALCTGLAAKPKQLDCKIETLPIAELRHPAGLGHITGKRIVVVGGGESAVDYADRLACRELNNEVYLSLQSGIRVSPRYHPIRGVPSDFLRNRLMLSIHKDMRNWIGQRFVELRILYQETFERIFPKSRNQQAAIPTDNTNREVKQLHKEWAYKLTKAAKDELFNMFHNKSDDFLDAVAEGRITIVGLPTDRRFTTFHSFDGDGEEVVEPDLVVPAAGYRAQLDELSAGLVQLSDFYLGCCHVTYPDLYLVGFARPIIGNVPTISEMQARYVCGLIAGNYARSPKIETLHRANTARRQALYKNIDLEAVYPVEMFPYCDRLARLMKAFPALLSVGSLVSWCRLQLAPATTMHYVDRDQPMPQQCKSAPIYMPTLLICFLWALKPVDWFYRALRGVVKRKPR